MSKKLNAFKGRLTAAQLADGMNAAVENAARLASDAEALFDRESYPTAVSVAALAIEEAGKVMILRELALARSDEEVRDCWKDYRSHTRKNASWIIVELFANGARNLDDFREMFNSHATHPTLLDNLKQLGFYTDCLSQARWSRPASVIDKELARGILRVAKLLAIGPVHTAREIELWIEHVGPVWKQEMSWMKQAVVNWQEAMHREGLSAEPSDFMKAFVQGSPQAAV